MESPVLGIFTSTYWYLYNIQWRRWSSGTRAHPRRRFQWWRLLGSGFAVPEVVVCNAGTSKASVQVVAVQAGVALVSGYSKNLMWLFKEVEGILMPSAIMGNAISSPEYVEHMVLS